MTKRHLECIAATAGLILLSPLFVLIALAIKLDDGGPVLFSQWRLGTGKKPFRIYKFRTMHSMPCAGPCVRASPAWPSSLPAAGRDFPGSWTDTTSQAQGCEWMPASAR